MICTECLWIAQVSNERVCFICIRKFSEQRPEASDCFLWQSFFLFVEVVVEARVVVPHEAVYACLEAEVHLLVLEAQVFVVENVAECRHVCCVDGECAVEVYG